MLKTNIILSTVIMLSLLLSGCTSKKISLNNFKINVVEINQKIEFLNNKLMPKKVRSKACKLKKENIIKLQKENQLLIDKVLRLNNLLSDASFSYKKRQKVEASLDDTLRILFKLRKVSKKRLLALENIKSPQKEEYLVCSLKIKPIAKVEACSDCRAVFN